MMLSVHGSVSLMDWIGKESLFKVTSKEMLIYYVRLLIWFEGPNIRYVSGSIEWVAML